MHGTSDDPQGDTDQTLARAIVLLLLSDEPRHARAPAALAAELGADSAKLGRALDGLSRSGVVCFDRGHVRASTATRRIDELGLIGI